MLALLRSLRARWRASSAVTWFGMGVSLASIGFLVYLWLTTTGSAQTALLPARAESASPAAASSDAAPRPPSLARDPDAADSPASAAAAGDPATRAPLRPATRAGATPPAPAATTPVSPPDGARADGGTLAIAAALLAQATTTPDALALTPGPAATLDAAAQRLVSTAAHVVNEMMAVGDEPTPAPLTPEPTTRLARPTPPPGARATVTPTPLLVVAGCPTGTRIDLNSASVSDLQALPGIGASAAQRIVDHRQQTPFVSVAELYDLHLVSRLTFARIRDLVSVGPAS
ncbi:MAG: helix-hairpin-helix domain-containing protein [Chloroflexi bacterium]|nr:helix-hairpin-helix domain-containing protein [Chloroflexota bacterium]